MTVFHLSIIKSGHCDVQARVTPAQPLSGSQAAFGWGEMLTVCAPPSKPRIHALEPFMPRFLQQAGRWKSDGQPAQHLHAPDSKILNGMPPCHCLAWDNGTTLPPKVCGRLTIMLVGLCMAVQVIQHVHSFSLGLDCFLTLQFCPACIACVQPLWSSLS